MKLLLSAEIIFQQVLQVLQVPVLVLVPQLALQVLQVQVQEQESQPSSVRIQWSEPRKGPLLR
ncbi:MAG: hypothetical protein HZA17_13525 [Nitrospirae bacterium]|nr:hypothetical protein [Nitrospirota bacterium]